MLVEVCERWLDDRLERSTAGRDRVIELEGKRLGVVVAGTGLTVVVTASGGRLKLQVPSAETNAQPAALDDCDAVLAASPLSLIALAGSSALSELKRSDAELSGQLHVAESFADAFALLAPDLEAELADWVGDLAAHQIALTARDIAGWISRAGEALEQNMAEYLQEESPALAQAPEVDRFNDAVDRLRDDVERAAERLDMLRQRVTPGL